MILRQIPFLFFTVYNKERLMSSFTYAPALPLGPDTTPYRLITTEGIFTEKLGSRTTITIAPELLRTLTREAINDVSFLLRSDHLQSVANILKDDAASDNDRFVAKTLLKNAVISAERILPSCQDTGTAVIMAKKGEDVYTGVDDAKYLSQGVFDTYQEQNLRYSQVAPLSMFEEKNTGSNLPAQIDILSVPGNTYSFLMLTKGGGSANKTFLYQETKSLLNETNLVAFLKKKIASLGTAACPPYHLAIVIGGTSAEANMKIVKLASAKYLDTLPTQGDGSGSAYRDIQWEEKIQTMCYELGIGAQFGGKYFVHDVRVIRLPRHASSCPVGIGVSCSADRNIKAKITPEGAFVEQLETNPARFLPQQEQKVEVSSTQAVMIDLNQPMEEIRKKLSKYPIKTRLILNGPVIVARDIAHARIKELLDAGKPMPQYFKDHPVYYAGPAKTPQGMPSGSFGPTTAGRMDPYVDEFQAHGGSMVMLAKGNRSEAVTAACKRHGGFYLGSIGGPAAILAKENITKVELVDFEDLGMEAVRKIIVKDFPAFIVVNDKGNDFFSALM